MAIAVQRFSNEIGEEYDLFGLAVPHHQEIQDKVVDVLIQNFPTTKNPITALEIGFGTGITSNELLSRDDRVRLSAIDNEPIMLQKALDRLKSFSSERFNLHTIDVLSYLKKMPDSSFDAVVSVWVLHNLFSDSRSEILREIFRVLKAGGIFVNGDKIAVSNSNTHKEYLNWQIKQFDIYDSLGRGDLKKQWVDHYIEDEDSRRILDETVFINELTHIGFKKISIHNRWYLDAIVSAVKF